VVVVLVEVAVNVVVVVAPGVVVVVVVTALAQPLAAQASQQLSRSPTHREPPLGATHALALLLIEHLVTPLLFVRQQVTKPGLPQVEREAHLLTNLAQLLFVRAASACCTAQLTYVPWFVAPAQSQFAATAARAFAMSLSSGSVPGLHAAWPGRTLTSRARSAASAGRGDLGADQVTMAVRFPPVGRQVSSDLRVAYSRLCQPVN